MTTNNEKNTQENRQQEQHPHGDKEQELIKLLIEKQAQVTKAEKERKTNEKKIKNIENSSTWKYSKPWRKFSKTAKTESYIKELETNLQETQKELYKTRERLNEAMLDDRKLNSNQVHELIKDTKDEAKLMDFIDEAIQSKKQHQTNYTHALRYAARLFMKEKTDYRNLVYSNILSGLNIEEIPEFMIRAGLDDERIPLRQAASFRASLNMRIRQKQLTGSLPEWVLDEKQDAYTFMDRLGVRKPWTSEAKYKHTDIPKEEGIVIKPADGAGSRGVYLVYSFHDIIDIKRSKAIDSWDGLIETMKEDLTSGWVTDDEWFMEELIFEDKQRKVPASDIKFYCFYGKVGLILEITRVPEMKYCWWTTTGEHVRTGKYDEDLFKGRGVSTDEIELASSISAKIPAPFIRIDFLRSTNGLVFGEFTPKPGNYDDFDELTDQWMGDYFIEAEGRLANDLLNGKAFNEYKALRESLDK
ncbi:teichuronopeptide biosynthesis [Virgibacillus sp. NKC19-16]|uniref:ATP-grasp fold amidoligase family protein n=1 Tax=Virgibacillus salidurans TaxID=2831673 RepID=UPI001F32CC90|nr:ATP-grasp fold amidoligase family protein [Virgibacillus sp. NKC19-16]UJL45909.1 teichuronopeptide biosynthesis [Virgibacillus sp. NKC19-16]